MSQILVLRFGAVAFIALLDQLTKYWADTTLEMYQQIQITGFFNITRAYNYGAAFSFLDNEGGWQRWFFTGVSLVVSIVLSVWLYRMNRSERWLGVSISLILGGAIGNLIDRAGRGYVVDFIQVHWNQSYFPSFNLADTAISCGTIILLILTLFEKGPDSDANGKTSDKSESSR